MKSRMNNIMPNWVRNKLYIVGPAQDIATFRAQNRDSYFSAKTNYNRLKTTKAAWTSNSFYQIKERDDNHQSGRKGSKPVVVDLSFDRLVPVPLAVTKKPYVKVGDNDYEDPIIPWCIKHWGCKWDTSESKLVRESKRRLFYKFKTPWSPPYPWLQQVSKQYPALRFSLHYWDDMQERWVILRVINGCL